MDAGQAILFGRRRSQRPELVLWETRGCVAVDDGVAEPPRDEDMPLSLSLSPSVCVYMSVICLVAGAASALS